jgi:hypothetical protein
MRQIQIGAAEGLSYSTEQAAKAAGIHYVTLRRWLADKDEAFHKWLVGRGAGALSSTQLSNGKRIWRFTVLQRAAVGEYANLPERRQPGASGRPRSEVRRDRNERKSLKRMLRRTSPKLGRVSAQDRQRNIVFRRYVKVLVELLNLGFRPEDMRLTQLKRTLVPESEVMAFVTEGYYAIEGRRTAEMLGKIYDPSVRDAN